MTNPSPMIIDSANRIVDTQTAYHGWVHVPAADWANLKTAWGMVTGALEEAARLTRCECGATEVCRICYEREELRRENARLRAECAEWSARFEALSGEIEALKASTIDEPLNLTPLCVTVLQACVECDSVDSQDFRLQDLNRFAKMGLIEPFNSEYEGRREIVSFFITEKGKEALKGNIHE